MIWDNKAELFDTVNSILSDNLDFVATYMAVSNLQYIIRTTPDILTSRTVTALRSILESSMHSSQKQIFFLYKKAADAIVSILVKTEDSALAEHSFTTLKKVISNSTCKRHRAAAEALGSISLNINTPVDCFMMDADKVSAAPVIRLEKLCVEKAWGITHNTKWFGRSLTKTINNDYMLVVKLLRTNDSISSLIKEAMWMENLCHIVQTFDVKFEVPCPVKIDNSYIFRLKKLPENIPAELNIHPQNYAIAFKVHKEYFIYPNHNYDGKTLSEKEFEEVLLRNTWLLGKLASIGIVHTAPIPLFHNRVQQNRRRDHGVYEWRRGGRLDQWLGSCRYPNIGLTGLRDFEHFTSINGQSVKLYRHIGTHILSLILITGSYFRNKDFLKSGFNSTGNPTDARDLFNKSMLKELLQKIFLNYYQSFTGNNFKGSIPFNITTLASRIIEEMGVDSHMEEILRTVDQNNMTNEEFCNYLTHTGYSKNEIAQFKRGEKNIKTNTGPHLGEFNGGISIPELIEYTATVSAFCISGKYITQKNAEL